MRAALLPLLFLAACSGGEDAREDEAAPAPVPSPTAPAPRTPQTGVTPAPGDAPAWTEPTSNAGDPKVAPYAEATAAPLVEDATPPR